MGILRTDRVSGLGGANAITGSTFFGNGNGTAGNYLRIETGTTDDFAFGTGDFTIEFWFNRIALSGQQHFYDFRGDTNTNTVLVYMSSNVMYYFGNGSGRITSGTVPSGEWVHFALVRSSASTKMYFNGTQTGSTYSDSLNLVSPPEGSGFIGSNGGTDGILPSGSYLSGHISNFRVQKGKAEYTADFTPPTHRLEKTPETVLLTCNSSGNVSNEETGKVVIPERDTLNDALPQASRFTPNSPVGFSTTTDVGTQFGSTFDGVTTFDSQAYMVPPGGNTRERNRGRAMWAGGDNPGGGQTNLIDFIQIQSGGIAFDFGDLSAAANQARGVSSFTRGVFGGGRRPHPSTVNTMDFVTIANTANAQDFGDLTDDRAATGEISSSTRGIFAAGFNPSNVNTIDFITIATLGNASNFGDTTIVGNAMAGTQSTTRGILAGAYTPSSPNTTNVIQYLTIATTGDAQDFGDLTDSRHSASGTSNGVRAVFMGGDHLSPAADNTIDFITIASTGNATDFGDLGSISIGVGGATSDKIRGVFGTGWNGSSYLNVIQQVTIATTGNSVDIGELTLLRHQPACLGDAHGGLSE